MPKARIFCVPLRHASRPTVSTLYTALNILREVSPLVPLPGLKTAVDIAFAIVMRVQNVRDLGVDFVILAQSTSDLMVAILSEIDQVQASAESVDFLLHTLSEIHEFVEEQSSRTWWNRFSHHVNLEERVKGHLQQLESCCRTFQITSLIRVRALLESANAHQGVATDLLREIKGLLEAQALTTQTQEQRLSLGLTSLSAALTTFQHERRECLVAYGNGQKEVLQAINDLKSSLGDGECQIFRQWDITPCGVLSPQNAENGPVYTAKLKKDGQSVLLKWYGAGPIAHESFLHDLRHWRALWHPNVLQFLGCSVLSAEHPFIVVSGVSTRDVVQYVRGVSGKSDPQVAFMTGLKMLQGISAALDYLRSNCRVGKYELQDCAKVSNMLLDQDGRVVLGQNIMHCVPGPDVHDALRLEQWILEQFWCITETILFGSTYDFTNWEVVFGKKGLPHMRPLLRLAAWYADQGFTSATLRIEDLAARISDRSASCGPMTWIRIREAFLETEGIKHNMYYRPPEPLDVELYDIGFMQNGRFTVLCNVASQVDFELEYQPPFYSATFPDIQPQVTQLPDGMTSYEFDKPLFAAIGQTASGKHVKRTAGAFQFMIDRMPSLLAEHRSTHPWLGVRDLIFIVGTNERPLSAAFEWRATDEHDPGPQRTVYFYGYPNARNNLPWGFWSFDPTPKPVVGNLHPQANAWASNTPPQTIMFVQLEREDIPSIIDV